MRFGVCAEVMRPRLRRHAACEKEPDKGRMWNNVFNSAAGKTLIAEIKTVLKCNKIFIM